MSDLAITATGNLLVNGNTGKVDVVSGQNQANQEVYRALANAPYNLLTGSKEEDPNFIQNIIDSYLREELRQTSEFINPRVHTI